MTDHGSGAAIAEIQEHARKADAENRRPERLSGVDVDPWEQARADIIHTLRDGNLKARDRNATVAAICLDALKAIGQFFHHAEIPTHGDCMFFDRTAKVLLRIEADAFLSFVSSRSGIARADNLFKHILAAIQDDALIGPDSVGIIPEAYWAAREGAVYLSNGDGQAVKITAGEIRQCNNGTDGVLFAAGATLAPWTITKGRDPFEKTEAFAGGSYANAHGLDLLRLWAILLPFCFSCKPPMVAVGDVGSGKTGTMRAVQQLYGLPPMLSKIDDRPKGEQDFWVNLDAGGLVIFDNADSHTKWLADALSNASTGGSVTERKLYTNSERCTLRARAAIAITSANASFAADPGFADRAMVLRLNRRERTTSEAAIAEDVAAHRDAGLSFVCHAVAQALADDVPTPAINKRHPDFSKWAVRIGRAIGREEETIAAMCAAESDKSRFNLENDFLGDALRQMVATRGAFTGTAAELLTTLAECTDLERERWSTRSLGKRLARLWPHIEGVFHAFRETDGKGIMRYQIAPKG